MIATGKKVTVISPATLSPREAYQLFLLALSTISLTVVPKGDGLRIVDAATARSETVLILKHRIPGDDDQVVRYVLRPSYVAADTLGGALDAMKSAAGNVTLAGSMLVLTDYSSTVRDISPGRSTSRVPTRASTRSRSAMATRPSSSRS